MKDKSHDEQIQNAIKDLQHLPDISWNVDKGWQDYIAQYGGKKRKKWIYSISACAAAIAFFLVWLIVSGPYQTIKVATENKKMDVTLNDGSRIWLNKNSSLVFNPRSKKITIQGEAYFELSGNHKYKVITPHGDYRTKKSHFNLKTRKNEKDAVLTVTKGKVMFLWYTEEKHATQIEEGTQARIFPDIAVIQTPVYDPNFLSWKTEQLHFQNTPLYLVVDKLEELNGVKVDFENYNIRYCRINSDFDNISIKRILEEFPEIFDCKVEYKGEKYLIKGRGCEV